MKTILVHYRAFGDDKMFVFTGCDQAGMLTMISGNSDGSILDIIYRECNHVDGTEWIARKPLRSLSVGDEVIIIDRDLITRYRCAMVGWDIIPNKYL
jgi:hypothetical protein